MGFDRLSSSSGKSPITLTVHPSETHTSNKSPRTAHRSSQHALNRKLEIEFISNLDKRIHDEDTIRRRHRSERTLASKATLSASSSSSSSDSAAASEVEDDCELVELLAQTRNRLENTDALRVRSHLLRPEDYVSGSPSSHLRVDTTKNTELCTNCGWLVMCAVGVLAYAVVAMSLKSE